MGNARASPTGSAIWRAAQPLHEGHNVLRRRFSGMRATIGSGNETGLPTPFVRGRDRFTRGKGVGVFAASPRKILTYSKGHKQVLDGIRSILANLRARDRAELEEHGLELDAAAFGLASPAVLARVFACEGRPAAIVTFHRLTPRALVASMMATDAWPRVARVRALGRARGTASPVGAGFERAECRTIDGHADAIALLERLGFVLECRLPRFGAHGASFLQYAWRLTDHVFVQHAEGAATTAAATT